MLGVHESYEADMYSRAPPDQHEQMEASHLIAYNAGRWREIMQILRRGEESNEVAVRHHIVVIKIECRSLCRWIKVAQAILPPDRVLAWGIADMHQVFATIITTLFRQVVH